MKREVSISENAAAISAALHENREKYDAFYKRSGENFEGFTSIYVGRVAIELTNREQSQDDFYDRYEWVSLVDHIAQLILDSDHPVSEKQLVEEALLSCEEA